MDSFEHRTKFHGAYPFPGEALLEPEILQSYPGYTPHSFMEDRERPWGVEPHPPTNQEASDP